VEEEIDLREYLDVIIKRWKWIVAATVVAVVTAAIVSFFLIAPVYEATATLLVTESPLIPRSLETKVMEPLLNSTEVEAQVVEALQNVLSPSEQEPGSLVTRIKVVQEEGGKSRVFRVSARASDPQKAAQIASTWAEVGAEVLREAQVPTDEELKIAEQGLRAAEQALWEFAEANGLTETDLRAFLEGRQISQPEGRQISQPTRPILSVEKRVELGHLLRARDIAEEIYLPLAREAEVARIASQAGTGVGVISLAAVVPIEPMQPKKELNIVIAGVLGLMGTTVAAFAVEYWRGSEKGTHSKGLSQPVRRE